MSCLLLLLSLTLPTVFAQQPPLTALEWADSLAKQTLQNEGLFTVFGGVKPISTVQHISFAIDTLTGKLLDEEEAAARMRAIQDSFRFLADEQVGFVLIPFRAVYGKSRGFELLVFHRQALENRIAAQRDFFLKRGVFPDSPAEQLLTLYEFEEKFDRFRAYGYFFGYPDAAVDFFVEAARHQEETGDFVTRDFFQIPVASAKEGHFVYAIPKDSEPSAEDLALRARAAQLLSRYEEVRDSRVSETSRPFAFLELFQEMRRLDAQ
ncbi:putative lipoprotein [Nitritalea halalkaliphila LW7]|uniref:Putative lipoprotein n=1 Tax=Nitritalea halalkaliphila LW7 TaxID=1189621 RepID=I5BX03_9BACT|nr:putative lipoprotein [Nitritalea halalkaliphila LW7]